MLLHEPFDFHAISHGDYIAAKDESGAMTYAAARERSLRAAAMLGRMGVDPGDRVVTIVHNSFDALLLILAASRIGAVCVPLSWRLAPPEWQGIIEDADARVVIADGVHAAAMEAAGFRPDIAIATGEPPAGWWRLEDLLADAGSAPPPHRGDADAVVLQLYTSGTTGRPKGAMITHANLLANISLSAYAIGDALPGERSLHVLPLFHIAGVMFAFRALSGGETLFIHATVDPERILRTLVEEEIRWTFIVPAIIQMLLNVPGLSGRKFPALRHIIYGASPISKHVLVKAMRAFGCGFVQGFGMTELSCVGTFLSEADHDMAVAGRPELLASAGRPIPGTRLRVVDAGGHDCRPGEIGEILIKGPHVFKGYWKLPDATAAALTDGWLRSGDAGSLDERGYLFIRDRIKDMIVTGGENVYPAEVEAVLHQHPRVAEATVIGIPDEKWGETVMAVIVPEPGAALDEAELDGFCKARLGGFKRPRAYTFVPELPRNASGKVLKRELRAAYWQGHDRAVA